MQQIQEQLNNPTAMVKSDSHFIEANTIESSLEQIRKEHIIPVFVRDNEPVISCAEFIEQAQEVISQVYAGEKICQPAIRLSHPIKGRIPEAKNKPALELLDHEKTLYYERMAFIIEIPSVQDEVEGTGLCLIVGGMKGYNLDNLYNKQGADQHFKIFVGYKVSVCTNLCIWNDGYTADLKVKNLKQLENALYSLLASYNPVAQSRAMHELTKQAISESQFAHLVGKCRMYKHLPAELKSVIPVIEFGEQQLATVVRDYYQDNSFCRKEDGSINMWKLYNLFTNANKSSYIDQFLDRSVSAFTFINTIRLALKDDQPNWYIK